MTVNQILLLLISNPCLIIPFLAHVFPLKSIIPLSGTIIAVNEDLEDAPDNVNSDPYGKGWLIKISAKDINDKKELLSSEEYKKIIS